MFLLYTLLAFLVALGVLVTFHELGHYLVARWCGVRILRFSVGFGKVLVRRVDSRGTEWALSAIPLGGYVQMQEDPPMGAGPREVAQAFNRQSVWARMAIVVAGPMFNFLLAIVIYAALSMAGTSVPQALVAAPPAGSPAAHAGLVAGDRILAVNGHTTPSWADVRWRLLDPLMRGDAVQLSVERAGQTQMLTLPAQAPAHPGEQDDPVHDAGLHLGPGTVRVQAVEPDSRAQAAGLRAGDVVTRVDGTVVGTAGDLVGRVQGHAGQTMQFQIIRDGSALSLVIEPASVTANGRAIGRIGAELVSQVPMTTVRYGALESLRRGALRTWDVADLSVSMIGRMIIGQVSWRNLSGPVTIADYAGQSARIGLQAYLAYLALISISIGVLNLLPIPMLDGGHLLYYIIEVVRGGRAPSQKWREIGQRTGFGLLMGLMGLALFNDFARLFT